MRLHFVRPLLSIALAFALTLPLPALARDYTDMWWAGPVEDGWGVNFTQNEGVIFATFFVYGPNKQPIWYVATMDVDVNGNYSGDLYQTTGTYFPLSWDPMDHSNTLTGTATFLPSSAIAGTLTYTVSGVPGAVTKNIQRQSLRAIVLAASYVGGQTGAYSGGSCINVGSYVDNYSLQVTQASTTSATLVFSYTSGLTCTLAGALAQSGQLYSMPSASYVCSDGLNTSASMYEVKATSLGIEGRYTAPSAGGGCREDANFSAVLK
jgi:hypothetical protein